MRTRKGTLDEVRPLHALTFPEDEWLDEKLDYRHWITYDGDRPVAFATVEIMGGINKGDLYFARVGVVAGYHNKGLQRRLMRLVARWGKRMGYKVIVTYVLSTNGPSLVNFIRMKYLVYRPPYKWAGNGVVYLKQYL